MRILELGGESADSPDRRRRAGRAALVERQRVGLLHGDDDLVAPGRQRHIPRLMWQRERAPRLHVPVIVVREHGHQVAAVVVDGVELPAFWIHLDARDVAQTRLRTEHPLHRLGRVVRRPAGRAAVHEQRVAVFVAENHAVVFGVERDPVEGGKQIRDRANRRDDAAERVRRPLVRGDAGFLRKTARRLGDLESHAVGAILGEQRVERRVVSGHAGRARGAGQRPRLAAGDEQPDRGRGGNQDATHGLSFIRFTYWSARPLSRA